MSKNKVALVIGGSSGIGLASAKQLLENGISTIILGRNSEKLAHARASLGYSENLQTLQADLYDSADVSRVRDFIADYDGHIKYLVNAAGYFSPKPFLKHNVQDYATYHDLNKATFFITQAVAINMQHHGGGAIVNVGSMWAKQAIKATPSSAYSMAKAALHSLTQHLAMELADDNIRVNAVSPAVVRTPIYEAFIDKHEVDSVLDSFNAFHPIGRVGTATDVAATISHLLSEKSAWITGAVWDIDGGVMAGRS